MAIRGMNESFVDEVFTPGALPPEEMARVQEMYELLVLQSDATRVAGRVAREYAEALLAVADERGEADDVAAQLDALTRDVFKSSPDLEAFLDGPAPKAAKAELIDAAFGGRASPLFVDFLKLLNAKDRLALVRLIAVAYRAIRDRRANRVRVLVESAVPLDDGQRQAVRDALAKSLDREPVVVVRTNPELIGGLVVHVGDKVFDTSVRTRLQTLRNTLLAGGSR